MQVYSTQILLTVRRLLTKRKYDTDLKFDTSTHIPLNYY